MKILGTLLSIAGIVFLFIGAFLLIICYGSSDPEIEGESGRTPLSAYLLSLIPVVLGILMLIISRKRNKNKISN